MALKVKMWNRMCERVVCACDGRKYTIFLLLIYEKKNKLHEIFFFLMSFHLFFFSFQEIER